MIERMGVLLPGLVGLDRYPTWMKMIQETWLDYLSRLSELTTIPPSRTDLPPRPLLLLVTPMMMMMVRSMPLPITTSTSMSTGLCSTSIQTKPLQSILLSPPLPPPPLPFPLLNIPNLPLPLHPPLPPLLLHLSNAPHTHLHSRKRIINRHPHPLPLSPPRILIPPYIFPRHLNPISSLIFILLIRAGSAAIPRFLPYRLFEPGRVAETHGILVFEFPLFFGFFGFDFGVFGWCGAGMGGVV